MSLFFPPALSPPHNGWWLPITYPTGWQLCFAPFFPAWEEALPRWGRALAFASDLFSWFLSPLWCFDFCKQNPVSLTGSFCCHSSYCQIRILGKGRVKRRWRSQTGFQPPVHSPCRHSGFVAPQFITRSSHPRDVTLVYHECKATPEISSLQEELCLHLLYDSGVLSFHLASESCFLAP